MKAELRRLWRERRSAVAIMMVGMVPMMFGMAGLIVDAGFWAIGQTRLQVAADAGAMGASYLLSNATVQAMPAASQTSTFVAVAQYEAGAVATKLVGTMNTPTVTWTTPDWKTVTVTVTSQPDTYFLKLLNITAPVLRATATATLTGTATACVLTLNKNGMGIQVDNMGYITAGNCPIFSDSKDKQSIYLNSGTISGSAIGAVGGVVESNSGSNTMLPATPNPNSQVAADPDASLTPPAPGACDATNGNYSAYSATPYTWAMHSGTSTPYYVFCGNTTFGGNSSTDTFAPGVYYVVNGDLTFNNATINSASGVSFVMTGDTPGSFSWTNYSNTSTAMTAPTTGPMAGVLLYQGCGKNGQSTSFQGGSTLVLSGTLYSPCSSVDIGNNAQVQAAQGKQMNLIGGSLYVHGSGALRPALSGSSGTAGMSAALTN